MLAERLEEWAHGYEAQGLKKGMQQGMQQGEVLALQKLLAKRFGVIPPEMTDQIVTATLPQIELWFDRAIDAPSLAAVFGDTPPSTH